MKTKFINKPLFKLQRKSTINLLIIFSVIVAALMFMIIAIYPLMNNILSNMSEAIGFANALSFSDYFNAEAFEIWILLICIFGSVLATSITTKEFKNGSYELIYTLNISRGEIVRTKLLRLILNVIYVNLITFVVSLIGLLIFGTNQFSIVNLLIYTLFAIIVTLQIAVLVFAFGLFNKSNFNTFGGILMVIIMYLFTTLSMSVEKLKWIGYISPLTTMNGSIMVNGFKGITANGIILAVWSVITIVLLIFSMKKFKNDDLC